MTDKTFSLRRSPRRLLERDGHPGPGPGHLALLMARAGAGKTAFLVDVGLDAIFSGQQVLHISLDGNVEKVRTFYDDILMELLRREKKLDQWAPLQLQMERRRHIHTYEGQSFTPERLQAAIAMLRDIMHFEPQVIVLDDLQVEGVTPEVVSAVKDVAREIGAELWITCQSHRDGPEGESGHLPPPIDQVEGLVDLAFRLDPQNEKMRLHILKDRGKMLDEDTHILLDPQTMLVTVGLGS